MASSTPYQLPSRAWPGLALAAGMALSLVWAILSEGTWDDDCVTRYYNVRNAFRDPAQFIGVWNRPLFVLVYALPLQLGTAAVALITALITTLTAYVIYRTARRDQTPFALIAIAFFTLQPLVFGLSFSALTEPLAALLVAIAVWSYRERRWNWFALSGALLPLARLELSVLLVVWAVALARERRWLSILMLIVPILIWNAAGFALEGDWLWLPHQVLTGEENRYGHLPVAFYPARYVDVLGPVVFYFLALGLLRRAVDRRVDLR